LPLWTSCGLAFSDAPPKRFPKQRRTLDCVNLQINDVVTNTFRSHTTPRMFSTKPCIFSLSLL